MDVTIGVTLTSKTPLLINRFHEEAAEDASSGMHIRKEKLSKNDDAKSRLYIDEEGNTFFPAENIRRSIIEAAKEHKIGRRSARIRVAAASYILPFEIPLNNEWHVDSRAVVIPATGGRIIRHRPMFDEWELSFELVVDTDLVSIELMKAVVNDAGRLVGLGDYRPARTGPYGKFTITKWDILTPLPPEAAKKPKTMVIEVIEEDEPEDDELNDEFEPIDEGEVLVRVAEAPAKKPRATRRSNAVK